MSIITVYENSNISGRGKGYDNSPGSIGDDNFTYTTTLDTTDYRGVGLVTQEWLDNGLKYSSTLKFIWANNRLTISDQTVSVNGVLAGTIESINAPAEAFLLYEGDAFLNWIYSVSDTIYGASANDKIYGYGARDRLYGYGGDDTLNGGLGSDYLFGGDGDDILIDNLPSQSIWPADGYYYGGNGTDTLKIGINSSEIMLSRNPSSGTVSIYSKSGWVSYAYPDIELIELADETITVSEIPFLGQSAFEFNSAKARPVYEFYNARSNAYFYTADLSERNSILSNSIASQFNTHPIKKAQTLDNPADYGYSDNLVIDYSTGELPYFYQGSSFNSATINNSAIRTIHRFYNEDTNHHLWSVDPNEIASIKAKYDNGELPWKYEGTSFFVYAADPDPSNPNIGEQVYRLYNSSAGRHFYTADTDEIQLMQLTGVWQLEGPAFWGE